MRVTRSALNFQKTEEENQGHPPNDFEAKNSSTDEQLNQDGYIYQEDELVWVKIQGYPWWPAVINKRINKLSKSSHQQENQKFHVQYEVEFLGDETTAYVSKDKIAQYSVNREFFIETAKKAKKSYNINNFELAVKEANELTENMTEKWSDQSPSVVSEEFIIKKKNRKVNQENKEDNHTQVKKPRCRRRQDQKKKNALDQRQLRKQMAVTLFKLLKAKTSNVSNQELKQVAIQLLKEHQINSSNHSLSECSQLFMALFTKLKEKSYLDIKSLYLKEKSVSETKMVEQKEENLIKKSISTYIYVDQWGYMHKCTDELTRVEISFSFQDQLL